MDHACLVSLAPPRVPENTHAWHVRHGVYHGNGRCQRSCALNPLLTCSMHEVDPIPRTSHVTPPIFIVTPISRRAALPGYGTKPYSPPRQGPAVGRGTANVPRQCSSSPSESLSHEVVGSGRGHARLLPKWGTRLQCQHPPSFLRRGLQWSSGLPGFGGTASAPGETYVHLSPLILEPSLCS